MSKVEHFSLKSFSKQKAVKETGRKPSSNPLPTVLTVAVIVIDGARNRTQSLSLLVKCSAPRLIVVASAGYTK